VEGANAPHLILATKLDCGSGAGAASAFTAEVTIVHLPHPRSLLAVAAAHDAFLFDFDGTLVDIAATPGSVVVPPRLPGLLVAVSAQAGGAVAIISGRPVAEIDHLLAELCQPDSGIVVSGEHGSCLRFANGTEEPGPSLTAAAATALETATNRLAFWAKPQHGLIVERKRRSVALHYRARPDLALTIRTLAIRLERELTTEMVRQPGKMVEELRIKGPDKGDALRRIMAQPAFRGRRPLFFGDDLTDEPAFVAAHELGGCGILIGTVAGRSTAALAALATPSALARYLEEEVCR
jgi:trehalose 6-phosphate phosphatase